MLECYKVALCNIIEVFFDIIYVQYVISVVKDI